MVDHVGRTVGQLDERVATLEGPHDVTFHEGPRDHVGALAVGVAEEVPGASSHGGGAEGHPGPPTLLVPLDHDGGLDVRGPLGIALEVENGLDTAVDRGADVEVFRGLLGHGVFSALGIMAPAGGRATYGAERSFPVCTIDVACHVGRSGPPGSQCCPTQSLAPGERRSPRLEAAQGGPETIGENVVGELRDAPGSTGEGERTALVRVGQETGNACRRLVDRAGRDHQPSDTVHHRLV